MVSNRIRSYLRQNVLGLVAIFIALSGTAYATHPGGANTISTGDIIDGEVREADVGQAAVTSAEIKNDSIVAGDVAPNTLNSARIADGTLSGADVANDSLTGADIGETTLSSGILQRRVGGSCPSGQAIRVVGQTGAVTCQALTGSSPLGPAGGDLTGNYPNPAIKSNAVNSAKVGDGSLTGLDLADESLSGTDITDGSVGGGDIGDGTLSGSDIGDGTLGGADVDEGSLGQVPSALLGGLGRYFAGAQCDPASNDWIDCGFVTLNLPSQARVLLIGRVRAFAAGGTLGYCRLVSNFGALQFTQSRVEGGEAVSFLAVPGVFPPGSVDVGVECQQEVGDIAYGEVGLSAVAIAPN